MLSASKGPGNLDRVIDGRGTGRCRAAGAGRRSSGGAADSAFRIRWTGAVLLIVSGL
jgi:hypothetical protein